jgi:hypothetical protein
MDSLDRFQSARHLLRVAVALDEDLVRKQCALADPRVLESDERLLCIARCRERVGIVDSEPYARGRKD